MAKVANLMANHNGNPTAVASLYDEKISVVKDENTVVLATVDTDTGINDLCGNEWTYYNGTDTTVMPSIGTYNQKPIFNVSASLRYTADIDVELGGDVPFSIDFYTVFSYARPSTTVKWYTVPIVKLIADDDSEISIQAGQVWYPEGDNLAGNVTQRGYAGYRVYFPEGYAGWGAGSTYYSTQSTHTPYVVGYFKLSYEANTVSFFPKLKGSESGYPLAGTYGADFDSVAKRRYVKIQIGGGTLTSAQIRDVRLTKGVALWNSSTSSQTPSNTLLYPSAGLPVKGNLCVRALTPIGAKTVSLLHFDDPDNPLKDECGNTWRSDITHSISTSTTKFEGGSIYAPGGYGFSKGGFNYTGQDLTVDFWVYPVTPKAWSNYLPTIFGFWGEDNSFLQIYVESNSVFSPHIRISGTDKYFQSISGLYLNSWQHIAVVAKANLWRIFINGVLKFSGNYAFPQGTYTFTISANGDYAHNNFRGYIDEFRVLDGVALWTENFTPPDKPYIVTQTLYAPLIMQNSPAVDDKTIVLKHFDDPDNPAKDECAAPSGINDGASFFINTETAKFGGGCLQFIPTGSTSNQYAISSNPVYFGGADFTIDFWVSGHIRFYSSRNSSVHRIAVNCDLKQFFTPSGAYTIFGAATNDWRHFALVYNWAKKLLYVYENGVSKGSYALDYPYLSRRAFFYCNSPGANYPPRADELRIVHGLQVWTSNFTPPTQPYTLDTYNGKNPPCIGVRHGGNNFYTVR